MRRHPALAELARDHHVALVVAQRLRRADAQTLAAARAALAAFVHDGGERHFEIEEQVLFPAFAAHGPADHPLVARALVEHVVLRRRIDELLGEEAGGVAVAHALGAALADHVRLEERELFPLIEDAMPEPALQRLSRRLDEARGAS